MKNSPRIFGILLLASAVSLAHAQQTDAIFVTVMDTADSVAAKALADRLTTGGYKARPQPDDANHNLVHVQVGPYASIAEAEQARANFLAAGYKSAKVSTGSAPTTSANTSLEARALAKFGGPKGQPASGKQLEQQALATAGVTAVAPPTGAKLEKVAVTNAGADLGPQLTGKALEAKSADAMAANAAATAERKERERQEAEQRAAERRSNTLLFLSVLAGALGQANDVLAAHNAQVAANNASSMAKIQQQVAARNAAQVSIHCNTTGPSGLDILKAATVGGPLGPINSNCRAVSAPIQVATAPPAINVSNNVASGPNAVTQSFNDLSAKLADAAANAAPPPPAPSPASTVAPVTSDPGPPLPPPPFSPLFTPSGETRPATDQELNGLLDGLKYDPVGVVLTAGEPQFVNLVDAAGEILMTVALGWSRTGPNTVKVLVNVTNLSNCIADTYGSFASSGKIDDKTWVGGIDAITYDGWKPVSILSAGRSETFGGTVTVGNSVKNVLIFHPELLRSTLSQCRTLQ